MTIFRMRQNVMILTNALMRTVVVKTKFVAVPQVVLNVPVLLALKYLTAEIWMPQVTAQAITTLDPETLQRKESFNFIF